MAFDFTKDHIVLDWNSTNMLEKSKLQADIVWYKLRYAPRG